VRSLDRRHRRIVGESEIHPADELAVRVSTTNKTATGDVIDLDDDEVIR